MFELQVTTQINSLSQLRYKLWDGAATLLEFLLDNEDLCEKAEALIAETFLDGCTMTQLNDYMAYELEDIMTEMAIDDWEYEQLFTDAVDIFFNEKRSNRWITAKLFLEEHLDIKIDESEGIDDIEKAIDNFKNDSLIEMQYVLDVLLGAMY